MGIFYQLFIRKHRKAMSKILVLTTIYPTPDIPIANNTNVVHYFAREWVKQGHEVYVIHNYPIYLKLFHWIAKFTDKLIASKFNTSVTSTYINKDSSYEIDGVKITRLPLFKPLPRGKVPKYSLDKQVAKIIKACNTANFVPDIITAHNFYPHLEMVNKLKREFFNFTKTCIVIHKQNLKMLKYTGKDYKKQIENVDIWGYRSLPLKREFENYTGMNPKHFMCYSGIPKHFLEHPHSCNTQKPLNRFIYVGSFIKRKYPEKILLALKATSISNFSLSYIGDGVNKRLLEKIIKKYHWENKVTLHGYLTREEIPMILAKSQCFIMISKDETFGLVYLEAMSMGCITIASKNEGMEGIIQDGFNGFLCEAGNEKELAQIITRINNLSNEEIRKISNNARNTAIQLTDSKVAYQYLKHLTNDI